MNELEIYIPLAAFIAWLGFWSWVNPPVWVFILIFFLNPIVLYRGFKLVRAYKDPESNIRTTIDLTSDYIKLRKEMKKTEGKK